MADAEEVDCRGRQDMLEMGFHGTHVASTADPTGTYGVGDSPFKPCALGILRLLGCRLLPPPGGL